MSIQKYLSILILGILIISKTNAQDTETKDEKTIIRVYIQINYKDSSCVVCPEELKKKLETIEGTWDVKILPLKNIATFYMYSDDIINKRKLSLLIRQAGFIPEKIEYSKEKPEAEKEEPQSL